MSKYILIIFGLFVIIYILSQRNKNKVCYELPVNKNPEIFGPYYWKALHNITDRIPCELCKPFAQKFMIFFHDVVNIKIGKPLFDPENYTEVLNEISTINGQV